MTRRLGITTVAVALTATFAAVQTAQATTDTTEAESGSTEPATTEGAAGGGNAEPGATSGSGWTVSTEDCTDPDAASAPIEGTVKIGMVAPLSGGPAATAFSPVTEGMQAYIDWANENQLVPGYTLELSIVDDQYNPSLTTGAVNGLLDDGVHVFSANIGSPNNAAVMDLLNEECVPQMMALSGLPEFGDAVDEHPWTFIGQMVYDVEAAAYATSMAETLGEGATAAIFYTNSEFGQVYQEAFSAAAAEIGIEIVSEQTIEATDTAPPTAQINAMASAAPSAIMAVPLGAGCPVFLGELANAKAANPGWEPLVYITNTCASQLILLAAGEAANGVYTSAYAGLHDVYDPQQAALPGVAEYLARMTEIGKTDFLATSAAGWNTAEVTVEIIRRAAESENGLSRVSIIEAARDLNYHPSMARDGANATMSGAEDGFLFEDVQIIQYDQPNGIWLDVGDMISHDGEG